MTATTGTPSLFVVAPEEPVPEAPMPSLVDEDDTTMDPVKDFNDNHDDDESPTTSSLAKEGMGQEALWVEEKSLLSAARQNGSPSKMKMLFRKKKNISQQPKQRHVLLLEDNNEDAQALGSAAERQAAQNILKARHLLEQALHPASFVNHNPSPEQLAQSAFELACEARRGMNGSPKKNSAELDQVLRDAVTKGVAAVRASQPDRARQLLEFVLPALPGDGDALLQQQLPNVATFDTGMSTLTTKPSYFLQSPRVNSHHNNEDVLSMSSLNEILDGPLSPTAPRVPLEICAKAAKVTENRPEHDENDDQNSVESSSTSSSNSRRRGRRNRKSKTPTQAAAVAAASATVAVAATEERKPRSGIFFGRRFKGSQKEDENQQPQQLQRLAPTIGEDKYAQVEKKPVPGQVKQVGMSVQDQRIVDMDARISQILLKAANEDDTCSLTSRDGVPVYTHDLPKHVQERERKIEQALSLDADDDSAAASYHPGAVRTFQLPQFVPAPQRNPTAILGHASLDGLQAAGMIDEDDGVIPVPPSPASSTAPPLDDDKYTVIAQGDDVTEDKYSMLPDCAFCDTLWQNMKALPSASPKTLTLEEHNNEAPETLMDKYATEQDEAPAVPEIEQDEVVPKAAVVEAPETAPTTNTVSTDDAAVIALSDDTASNKSTGSSKRRGMAGRLFGKLKSSSKPSTADVAVTSKSSRGGIFGSKKHSKILQEKSETSLNQPPRTNDEEATSSLFKITVTSNEEPDNSNDNKHSLLHEADAATEGSEEPEVQSDSLVEHIRAQQQRAKNRLPMDP